MNSSNFIEDQVVAAAIIGGVTFNPGFGGSFKVVTPRGAREIINGAIKRALVAGHLPDDVARGTRAFKELEAEREAQRKAELEAEAANLRAELDSLNAAADAE